jgi:predicted permease
MLRAFRKFFFRLRILLGRKSWERDMHAEMAHHLDLQAAELHEEGASADVAKAAALREFGNLTHLQERCRDEHSLPWLRQLGQDLSYGSRILYNNPGFPIAAVVTLALGIGANTAIFSLVEDILFRQLPVTKPNELVLFRWSSEKDLPLPINGNWETDPITHQQICSSFTQLTFDRFKFQNQTMTGLAAFADTPKLTVVADNNAEIIKLGEIVSGGFFNLLGTAPVAGRLIDENDDRVGTAPVAVISYNYWQRRFGGDRSVIGKSVSINHRPITLIGITPRGFSGTLQIGDAPDIYIPLSLAPELALARGNILSNPAKLWWLRIMGRRTSGVELAQIKANLSTALEQTALESAAALGENISRFSDGHIVLIPGPGDKGLTELRHSYAHEWKILALLGLTLLTIACANIASLLFARGNARRREIGIRLAVGAGRGRIVRQLLTETTMLAGLGGILALPIAIFGQTFLVAMHPPLDGHILVLSPHLDLGFFSLAIALSLLTGVAVGLLPALRATRIDILGELQGGGGIHSANHAANSPLAQALLIVQIALSLMLLIGAGLLITTLQNLRRIDVGFDPQKILLFEINPNSDGTHFDLAVAKNREIAERIRAIPSVQACTFSKLPLLSVMGWNTRISITRAPNQAAQESTAMVNAVGVDFFSTYGMSILSGRGLDPKDQDRKTFVAVINQAMATSLFGNENPVGQTLEQKNYLGERRSIEVVGISKNASYSNVRDPVPPTIFLPFSFSGPMPTSASATFAVRSRDDPRELISSIRQIVASIDPTIPLDNIRTQEKQIEELSAQERLFAWLSGFFSLLAVSLIAIGLYGMLSYTVSRRIGEMGVRMAIGAHPREILWIFIKECLFLVAIGIAIGIAGAYAGTRILSSLLYGLAATDSLTFAIGAALLVLITISASWFPARRASRLNPITALRNN